jgi:hypothetical protein
LEEGARAGGVAELGRDLAEVDDDLDEETGVAERLVQLEGLAEVTIGAAVHADRGVGHAEVGELDAGGEPVAELGVDLEGGAQRSTAS